MWIMVHHADYRSQINTEGVHVKSALHLGQCFPAWKYPAMMTMHQGLCSGTGGCFIFGQPEPCCWALLGASRCRVIAAFIESREVGAAGREHHLVGRRCHCCERDVAFPFSALVLPYSSVIYHRWDTAMDYTWRKLALSLCKSSSSRCLSSDPRLSMCGVGYNNKRSQCTLATCAQFRQ